ncbi:hypothetical protein BZL41_21900 [Pseudomonas sp. PIC25]|uniref:hypothetical protein n=1 Tax=Pseudomonas sp. PIC25 TaxID=1958773 RepID=UPI000BAB42D6|nr:hypothetical protein [Pseudomonas sp. PIC25]PAU54727.1 hypothetical protein BZL41_21900 [Pseudomonas sp. PIC25]
MSIEEIQEAIECWASRPTWFNSHPSDIEAFEEVISNLRSLNYVPSKDELAEAIYDRVGGLASMLDTPRDIGQAVQEFAAKIHAYL